jgi:sugar lactone lactonase YvrE
VDELGEAPFWDEHRGELLRVDIPRGAVHGWNPSSGTEWCRRYDGEVSAVIPCQSSDGLVVAAGHRVLVDDGAGVRELARIEEDVPDNRLNDCKCDPKGRLWAGTMSKSRRAGTAALYRLEPGGEIERVVTGTTISNGLAWSPCEERMYFVDSPTQRIDAFDFDPASGQVSSRRAFAELDPRDGMPDGLTVDAEGGVWVCLFGGGALRRYAADGTLTASLPLPAVNPTSLVFGGPDLRTLYVTSAAPDGAVLALEPGTAGLPGNRFGGTADHLS